MSLHSSRCDQAFTSSLWSFSRNTKAEPDRVVVQNFRLGTYISESPLAGKGCIPDDLNTAA